MGRLDPGAVCGEMSLLTGEPRSSTERSVDEAVVYEIGKDAVWRLVEARPALVDDLAALMEQCQRANDASSEISQDSRRARRPPRLRRGRRR